MQGIARGNVGEGSADFSASPPANGAPDMAYGRREECAEGGPVGPGQAREPRQKGASEVPRRARWLGGRRERGYVYPGLALEHAGADGGRAGRSHPPGGRRNRMHDAREETTST